MPMLHANQQVFQGAKGMKPAHPLAWRRISRVTLSVIRCALYLPWATPLDTVILTPERVNPQQRQTLVPPQACQDFYPQGTVSAGRDDEKRNDTTTAMTLAMPPATLFWQASDCTGVWASWTQTLPDSLQPANTDRRRLREVAADMRQRGDNYRMVWRK